VQTQRTDVEIFSLFRVCMKFVVVDDDLFLSHINLSF